MALSEREQQVLRDLEKQLHADDPSLAGSMGAEEEPLHIRDGGARRPSPRHIGAGVALLLVGLSVVIGGVAVGHGGIVSILVGLGGFALAVWGVSLMLTTVEQDGADGRAAPGSGRGSSWGRFMDRNAERWDRRRDTRD